MRALFRRFFIATLPYEFLIGVLVFPSLFKLFFAFSPIFIVFQATMTLFLVLIALEFIILQFSKSLISIPAGGDGGNRYGMFDSRN